MKIRMKLRNQVVHEVVIVKRYEVYITLFEIFISMEVRVKRSKKETRERRFMNPKVMNNQGLNSWWQSSK